MLPETAPQTLSNLTMETGAVAVMTAGFIAPIVTGWHAATIQSRYDYEIISLQHRQKSELQKSVRKIIDSHPDGKNVEDNWYYRGAQQDFYALKRFEELYKKPSHKAQAWSTVLSLAPTGIMPLGCLPLWYCDCPKMAAAVLAISYASAGTALIQEKMQDRHVQQVKNQIDREVWTDKNYETYRPEINAMIQEIAVTKKEMLKDNKYKLADSHLGKSYRDLYNSDVDTMIALQINKRI